MSFRWAIALGGGGVRGLASIGVLMALEEEGLMPDIVTGTSMGAIVGSVYASSMNALETRDIITGYLSSDDFLKKAQRLNLSSDMDKGFLDGIYEKARKGYFYYRTLFRKSVVSPEAFFSGLDAIIPDKSFSELRLPFACVALDLISGYTWIHHSGSVRPAVKSSSAVPGILPPVEIEGKRFVDGGWVESVPISAARFLKADFVVGVDVSRDITPIDYDKEIKNSLDIIFRADDIARSIMNTYRVREADFVIHPEVGSASWSDFENLEDYVMRGYRSAKDRATSLRKAMRSRRIRSALWRSK